MKSPIKDVIRKHKSHTVLRDLIPRGSVIDSFLFFAGDIEFSLTDYERFVVAHTSNQLVYEFWECAGADSDRLYQILTSKVLKFKEHRMFEALQEAWPTYPDPFVRSSLFFLLNRCSNTGFPSYGTLDMSSFNTLSLSYLKRLKTPANFHLKLTPPEGIEKSLQSATHEYLVVAPGTYKFNLFEHGSPKAFEETILNHDELHKTLTQGTKEQKWVLIYNYHSRINDLYKGYNQIMVNKHGERTKKKDECEEIIIANF